MVDREDLLALADVIAAHRAAPDAGLVARANWKVVGNALIDNRAAGLAYGRITAAGLSGLVPAPALEALKQHYRANQFSNALLLEEARRILETARAGNLDLIPLKGLSLLESAYADPGHRKLGDLDFLVHPGRAAAATAALEGLGYSRQGREAPGAGARDFILTRGPLSFRVDLSWVFLHRTAVGDRGESVVAELAGRARRAAVAGVEVSVLRLEDQIMHIAGHVALHHNLNFAPGLTDLALLTGRGGAPDWDDLERQALRYGLVNPVTAALGVLGDAFGIAAGGKFPARWRRLKPALVRSPAGAFLKREWVLGAVPKRARGTLMNWARFWWHFVLRQEWRSRIGCFSEYVFPDRERLRKTYRVTNPALGLLIALFHVPVFAFLSLLASAGVVLLIPAYAAGLIAALKLDAVDGPRPS